MQAGTGASAAELSRVSSRVLPGLSPVTSRNVRPKVPRLPQPVWNATSLIDICVSRSSALAFSMRRVSR
jgi:hypothetical protein